MKEAVKLYRGKVVPKKGTTEQLKEKKRLYDRFVKEEGLYLNAHYLERAFDLWQKEKLTLKRLIKAIPKLKNNTDPNLGNYTDGSNREAWLKEVRRSVIATDAHGKETVYPSICDAIKTVGGTHYSGICNAIRLGCMAYGYHWRYAQKEKPFRAKDKIGF